jgi:hypothetical protein
MARRRELSPNAQDRQPKKSVEMLFAPLKRRLKGLESENVRLKKLLADAMLDNAALKDLLAKKW